MEYIYQYVYLYPFHNVVVSGILINVVCCVGRVDGYKSKYEKVGVLPIRIVYSNVSSVGPSSERNRSSLTKDQRLIR